jgi:hypothetical protein
MDLSLVLAENANIDLNSMPIVGEESKRETGTHKTPHLVVKTHQKPGKEKTGQIAIILYCSAAFDETNK